MEARRGNFKVFVVTASAALRRRLTGILNTIPGVELAGLADGCEPAVKSIPAAAPDLVLLHTDPRKSAGLELIDHLASRCPQCKLVILWRGDAVWNDGAEAHDGGRPGICIAPEEHARIRACVEEMAGGKHAVPSDRHLVASDGRANYLYDYVDCIGCEPHGNNLPDIARGMTERRCKRAGRRQSEIERQEAADRFHAFIEQLPGIPYIANLDKHGSNIYVSPRIEQLLGFTAEQWCRDPDLRIRQLHAEDRPAVLKAIADAAEAMRGFSIDYRIHRRDGTIRWLHDEATVFANADANTSFLQGTVVDITERKQAQAELERSHQELQELIAALDSLRVEEQKRLAHELHDDFGQLLAAMKMDISALRQYLPACDAKVAQSLGNINDLVDAMVASVRRIVADLPPKILEDVGLFGALEMMIANFEKHHKVACRLLTSQTEPKLDTRVATAIYRMIQEMLNNVAKHASATRVEASVECSDVQVRLRVTDNGRGIVSSCFEKPGSFGLIGMRERAIALGGEMTIDSSEGKGTVVRVTIPLNKSGRPGRQ